MGSGPLFFLCSPLQQRNLVCVPFYRCCGETHCPLIKKMLPIMTWRGRLGPFNQTHLEINSNTPPLAASSPPAAWASSFSYSVVRSLVPSAKVIHRGLDKVIISQDKAKKVISATSAPCCSHSRLALLLCSCLSNESECQCQLSRKLSCHL
jgi:hypothetical protein